MEGTDTVRRRGVPAAVLAGVVLLVALVVVAVLVRAGGVDRQSPGSAEETVQRYFEALTGGRPADMTATFTPELAAGCTARADWGYPKPRRVVLTSSTVNDDETIVKVRITLPADGGLVISSESTLEEQVVLRKTGDGWRIDEVPWPYLCEGKVAP